MMDTGFSHWQEVRARLEQGVFSVTDELALIERGGDSAAETSYLTAKYGSHTVATPTVIETMAKVIGPKGVQIYMTSPTWARQLARRGVDMVALGLHVTPQREERLVVCRGGGQQVGQYPERTLLLIDVHPHQRVAATFARTRGNRIVYLGRRISADDTGCGWHLDSLYPAYGHTTGSELRVYERLR